MKRQRRKHSKEFKQEAVSLVTEGGYSTSEAAKALGINQSQLNRWKRELEDKGEDAFPGNGNRCEKDERIRQLEAENRRLKMEREILKKATAFFAKDIV